MTSKNQGNSGRFVPGDPRRGRGRAPGQKNKSTLIQDAIKLDNGAYFAQKAKEEGRAIIDKFIDAAKRGQPWAIQEFFNREFGRVTEKIEHSGDIKLTARFDFDGDNG